MSIERFDRVSALAGNEAVAHHPGTPTVRRIVELEAERDKARATVAELRILLQSMNHMVGDYRGGDCICIKHDGSLANRWHAGHCAAARALLARLEAEKLPSQLNNQPEK